MLRARGTNWILQVRLLDITLDGSRTGKVNNHAWDGVVSAKEAASFLADNPTAKIVVTVDTHSFEETGMFLWTGATPTEYQACGLDEVNAICPQAVTAYLTPCADT